MGGAQEEDYAEGSECRVMVEADGDWFEIRAVAKEPDGPPCRLIDIRFPVQGIPEDEFNIWFDENGLTGFRHADQDSLILGGAPGSLVPDTAMLKGQVLPNAGRNEPCPCGSGKKFKKCCLQWMGIRRSADREEMRRSDGRV